MYSLAMRYSSLHGEYMATLEDTLFHISQDAVNA